MAGIRRISIEQQLAALGIRSTPARLNITQPRMRMRITNERPQMEIVRRPPSFKINRKKLNSEMGISTPVDLSRSFRDQGKAGALRGARTAVEDGNFLGNTKIRGDKVGKLARNKRMSEILRKREANIGLMPRNRPEVVWDTGQMSINWSKHSLVIDWDGDYMPQLTIDPKYNIEIFLRNEPYFKITVEEVDPSGMPGQYVDQAI